MLIRFEAANFRSILDPVELSMVAVDDDRDEARPAPNLDVSLLPVAAVFGANASGKSNVLAALHWLSTAIRDSVRFWDDGIPVEPFAFTGNPERSEFTVEALVHDVRFEYIVELDRERVHYEGLFHYPAKKRRRVFERDGDELRLQRGLGALSGTRELLTRRTLALSVARRFDEPLVSDFARVLTDIDIRLATGSAAERIDAAPGSTVQWFGIDAVADPVAVAGTALIRDSGLDPLTPADRVRALTLLKLADLGIENVVIESNAPFDGRGGHRIRINLLHRTAEGAMPLDFRAESHGTQEWFGLIGPVLSALRDGTVLLFDELDASLHPTLSAELIRLFHDPVTNPSGAQLIFTTHDTNLLNHLNRDEVWFTEKNDDGATTLRALAEFGGDRVRRSQNLERGYLHGRFGALPDVDRTDLLRSLGLTG